MLLTMIVGTTVSTVVGAVTSFLMKRIGFDPARAAIVVGAITRIVSSAAVPRAGTTDRTLKDDVSERCSEDG